MIERGLVRRLERNGQVVIRPEAVALSLQEPRSWCGCVLCRRASGGGWSASSTVRIEGGSVGFQIGGSSTDLIMLVMTERGSQKLLESRFTLGAEGSVAAGPVGRTATAQSDVRMHAGILSWSRSQGLFAGFALQGATLRQDLDDNTTLYGT